MDAKRYLPLRFFRVLYFLMPRFPSSHFFSSRTQWRGPVANNEVFFGVLVSPSRQREHRVALPKVSRTNFQNTQVAFWRCHTVVSHFFFLPPRGFLGRRKRRTIFQQMPSATAKFAARGGSGNLQIYLLSWTGTLGPPLPPSPMTPPRPSWTPPSPLLPAVATADGFRRKEFPLAEHEAPGLMAPIRVRSGEAVQGLNSMVLPCMFIQPDIAKSRREERRVTTTDGVLNRGPPWQPHRTARASVCVWEYRDTTSVWNTRGQHVQVTRNAARS